MSGCRRAANRADEKSCLDLETLFLCDFCRLEQRERDRKANEAADAYRASRPLGRPLFDGLGIPIAYDEKGDVVPTNEYPRKVRALGMDPSSPEGREAMYRMIEEDEKRIREVSDE